MGTKNQFNVLIDNDDPSRLITAAQKKADALPSWHPRPAQAVKESRNYGAPARNGAGRGGPGRGRGGFRGGRTGPRHEFGEGAANGVVGERGW
ncbi:RGG repeats nuclear RNA binding protein A-like [Panicum virgatum]|uniref:RGG repeats nuclear RNA binding protein A-like n=1 Tax=Panicum virgatum TaxID=38727 RepID=UPI0019D65128|nr:RGG repeats nuclear RNA binding protein A-like [Panicum virgatum]